MQNNTNKTILIAPLDWGLGHATRCIPIINALLQYTNAITIAATGKQLMLLQNEFPNLHFIAIPNYNIQYGKSKITTILNLFWQLPKIKKAIITEHNWLQQLLMKQHYDIVLSDNRYGLYNKKTHCILITHQLQPMSLIADLGQLFLQKQLYNFINKYNQCWVIDNKGNDALAGTLSNPTLLPQIETHYIGTLTRFVKTTNNKTLFALAIILSGPEPQRTVLENKLIAQLKGILKPIVLIRGTNKNIANGNLPKNITTINIADTKTIQLIVDQSNFVLCRSGYTSLMDYLTIGAKCIVVPTPGQTEQEYLAKYTSAKKYTFYAKQKNINLMQVLQKAKEFKFEKYNINENLLQKTIKKLMNQ